MKLLVVTQYFYPENFRVNELVTELVARGHEVDVLTGLPNYPHGRFFEGYGWRGPRRERLLGAIVRRVPMLARGNGKAIRLALNYLSFAMSASLAALVSIPRNYDAIFVFEPSPITVGLPALVAARRSNAPVLFWVLDLWPESLRATGAVTNEPIIKAVGVMVRGIYARCSLILAQSRGFFSSIAAHGVDPGRLRYFPNWIEADYEKAAPPAARAGDGTFRIVYAGNIGTAQDFPAIIEAASMLAERAPQVRWVIAGDGRMAPWVRDQVERRGLAGKMQLLGQLPGESMPALFATADALLVALRPDPIFSLTIPGKVQSYLAAGKPLLAMLDGEGARVVEDAGAGLVARAGDPHSLAACVIELVSRGAQEVASMGLRGQEYAMREFGRQQLFDKLEAWLHECSNKS